MSINREDSVNRWYAVQVRSNFERQVAFKLRALGYEDYLPVVHVRKQWSDRVKEVEQPLFSGYVFCRLEAARRLPVLTIPGVVQIVGFGKTPVSIPDHELEAVRTMVQMNLTIAPWPYLELGQKVCVEGGPLKGVEGILTEVKNQFRLVVSINLLKRSIAVEVDRAWIRPISPHVSNIPSGVCPVASSIDSLSSRQATRL